VSGYTLYLYIYVSTVWLPLRRMSWNLQWLRENFVDTIRTEFCKKPGEKYMCKQFTPLSQIWLSLHPFLYNYHPSAMHRITSFEILTKKGEIVFTFFSQVWLFSTHIFTQLVIYEAFRDIVLYRISPDTVDRCGNLNRTLLLLELQRNAGITQSV
jgi:hypothetical protein